MKRANNRWSFYGLIGGLNMLMAGMFYVINIAPPVAAASTTQSTLSRVAAKPTVPIRQGVPVRIGVPSLGIDLDVGLGIYDDTTTSWTVDDSRAYYAALSVPSNDHNGTTLIYGHAQAPVFARLFEIQVGSEAVVTTDTGYTFHYRYVSMQQVVPTDVSVLRTDGPPTLVLQTCMGVWDAYRGLFTFTLESVTSP